MKNQEIAKIFNEIADFLDMEGVAFKPLAYRKVAVFLEGEKEDIEKIYKDGGKKALMDIPGVGENIAEKIKEYLKTGKIRYYKSLQKKTPVNVEELMGVEGLGPKKIKILYEKLRISNLTNLEKAAKAKKISPLFGFGEKTEKNILQGIEFLKRSKGRFLLGEILPKVKEVYGKLEKLKEIQDIEIGGSIRRMKETIGDIDFLVASDNPKKVMDFFISLPGVIKVWQKGATKSSVRMREGFDMDIRVLQKNSYGAALQYFTGSKEHNIKLRKIAIEKGLKLSEYGLFRGKKIIASDKEESVYNALGMDWIAPELREDRGEIEAARDKKLPKLIGYGDIKGDLHFHSDWDGGADPIKDMAAAAMEMDYEYIGVSDHTKFLRIEHGLDEKDLEERNREIDELNSKFEISNSKFRILKGCEANIMNDGSIDIKDSALKKLDYVIAGVHSSFKMSGKEMTKRIIKAMENPNVDIISHPTGRILKQRDEYEIDFSQILKAAKDTGTLLEINSSPDRLDLNDVNIKKAKEAGVKMIINTDSHNSSRLGQIELGIAQARRGWAEKSDISNCWPLDRLLKFFK
jgi:DNA polymerase (family X)